jgi:hypothetical protein
MAATCKAMPSAITATSRKGNPRTIPYPRLPIIRRPHLPLIVILKLRLPVAQRDLVRLGDVIGLDCSQSFTQALASLSQQLERVGGGILGSTAIWISPVLLDEVSLKGRGDFVGRLQRVVDGPVPCGVVNYVASIPRSPWLWADGNRRRSPDPRFGGHRLPSPSGVRFCRRPRDWPLPKWAAVPRRAGAVCQSSHRRPSS